MKRIVPIIADLVFVLIFAVIGRLSHGLDPVGVLVTAWPFLVACLIAWAAISLLRLPGLGWREGLIVWLVTMVGGLALRLASGETAAPAFVLVATSFLCAAFFGWRVVWGLLDRRNNRSA